MNPMIPTTLSPLGMGGELMIPPTGVNPASSMMAGGPQGFWANLAHAFRPMPGGIFETPGEPGAGPAGWSALLGQLAGAITGPNSWQGRVGQVGAQWGAAKQYADLLPKLMSGQNPNTPATPQGAEGSPNTPLKEGIKGAQKGKLAGMEDMILKSLMTGGTENPAKSLKEMGLK